MAEGKRSVQKEVEGILKSSFFLEEAVVGGTANFRAVARRIKPLVRGASVESVAMAIRRYREKARKKDSDKALLELARKSRIRVRTGVCDFTLESGKENFSKVAEIVKRINPGRGETLHIVFGEGAITLIVDFEHYDLVRKASSGILVEERKNVAALSIVTPKNVERIVGWVALLSRLMARNGINMIETFSCYTETILILEEADVPRALETIRKAKGE